MLVVVPVSAALKLSGNGKVMANIPAWEQLQSLLMLLLAVSGGYLLFFRMASRRRRIQRQTDLGTARAE